jgi:drug/metabolite transporter (DMT)-like permease
MCERAVSRYNAAPSSTPSPIPPAARFMVAYIQFVLICLFFGSNFILMDRATRYFGPIEVGFGRLLSATAILALIWLLLERRKRISWRDLGNVALVGLISNAYPYAIQPMLIAQGFGHSFFGMMVAFTPLLTIMVSIPLLGIKPTARQLIGVLVGLGCVVLMMYDGNLRGISPLLLTIAVTVPLSYALGNTWLRRTLSDAPPTPIGVVMMLFAMAGLAPLVASQQLQAELGVLPPDPRVDAAIAIPALLTLGALGTGACVWMFVRLVQTHGPLFAGMVTYVVPVLAMLWGLADGETITTQQIIAITGTLSMVALVQAPQKRAKVEVEESPPEWSSKQLTDSVELSEPVAVEA